MSPSLLQKTLTLGEIKELATLIMEHEGIHCEGKMLRNTIRFSWTIGRMSKKSIMERLLSALVDLFEQTPWRVPSKR